MTKFIPPGFNRAAVVAGLYKAMGFAEPNDAGAKVTFHFAGRTAASGTDEQGVPFSPAGAAPDADNPDAVSVPCAVEFRNAGGQTVTFGQMLPAEVVITVIDTEYARIRGFSHLVAGGDRYVYDFTEPVNALGSIDIYIIHAKAENER